MATRTVRVPKIPFNRFFTVACAGLVAFLALMQGTLTVSGYRPCGLKPLAASDSINVAMFELGIAAVSYLVFLLGARRLRKGWSVGAPAYDFVILALLIGQGLLAYIFIRSSVCAG